MRLAGLIVTAALVSGCSILEDNVQRGFERITIGGKPALVTTADVRIVTFRPHPLGHREIVCAEPTPDVARALATALQVSAEVSGRGGGSFGGSSAEAVTELAGRSTALLGLRDGLFRACEAYANGIIGDDAYALILSRYGQLMTTLFLSQDIASAARTGGAAVTLGTASAPGVAVKITGKETSVETKPVDKPAAENKAPEPAAPSAPAATPSAAGGPAVRPGPAAQAGEPQPARARLKGLVQLASVNPADITLGQTTPPTIIAQAAPLTPVAPPGPSAPAAGTPAAPALAAAPPCVPAPACPPSPAAKAKSKSKRTVQRVEVKSPPPPPPLPPAQNAADAIMRMGYAYLNLNPTHGLISVCINELDNSRFSPSIRATNQWVRDLCYYTVTPEQLRIWAAGQ